MLELKVQLGENFDESSKRFVPGPSHIVRLEHSLVSLSKWESEFEKPFLSEKERTTEETLAYIDMMCLDGKIPPEVLYHFTSTHYDAINKYINAKMSATTIHERPGSSMVRETITSELIYYWMVMHNIPFQCETWHLARLLMLIRVCNHKNSSPKKRSPREIAMERRAENERRRRSAGSRG